MLGWILYLSTYLFFISGSSSPESVTLLMTFLLWQGRIGRLSIGSIGKTKSVLYPLTVCMVGQSQGYCKTSPQFLSAQNVNFVAHIAEPRKSDKASTENNCTDYSFLCGWPHPAIKVKVFQGSMNLLLNYYFSSNCPEYWSHIFFLYNMIHP